MSNPHLKPRVDVIHPGEAAPDFTLPTQNRGETFKLSDAIKKQDVIIGFFPMAFTGVCATEMQCITKELQQKAGAGALVVGLSCDSGPALKAWCEQLELKQTLLSDMHREVCKAYGLYWPDMNVAWRGTVIVGKDGKVKWSQKRDIGQAMNADDILAAMS